MQKKRDDAPETYSNTSYVLGVLLVVYVFNFIDRQIIAILAPAIKADLGLSDTQIGALSGIAFGIFYATLGIPIARLADKYSRVNIISICLAIWSLMTAVSGLANNFVQLVIARIGVAVGEAGGVAPSHSLIADYFAPDRRATALGIFSLGVPIGVLLGNLAGGWVSELYGWRYAFFIVGVPGVLLAILMKLTVKEPPRGYSEPDPAEMSQVSFVDVFRTMWGIRSFRYLAFAFSAQAFVNYGALAWMPSFLIRSQDMSLGEVGTALGIIMGVFGGAGALLSGIIGDRLAKRNVQSYMLVPALAYLVALPAGVAVYLVEDLTLVLLFYTIVVFSINLQSGPVYGVTQSLAPLAMRAAASALLLFASNFTGLVFGTTVVGILSDLFQSQLQVNATESLRIALLVCNLGFLFCCYYYWKASRTLEADLARVSAMTHESSRGVNDD